MKKPTVEQLREVEQQLLEQWRGLVDDSIFIRIEANSDPVRKARRLEALREDRKRIALAIRVLRVFILGETL